MRRRFLVSFPNLPIDRGDVKKGANKPAVARACRCVNVGLFLSHDLRRDVEVLLLIGPKENLGSIAFPGKTLKRVAPDERSVSFFLLKAYRILQGLQPDSSETMDNGIVVSRTSLDKLCKFNSSKAVYLSRDTKASHLIGGGIKQYADYIYESKEGYFGSLSHSSQIIFRPPNPERMILDVNVHCDQMK